MGAHDGECRYRINKRAALPKFISPRNPFAPARQPETPPLASAEVARKNRGQMPTRAKLNSTAVAPTGLQAWVRERAARWIGDWKQRFNPLPQLPGRPGPARSAGPRFTKAPVQSELSLDKVRVMRNDLSDADFEVVPARTPVALRVEQPVALPQQT